MGNVVSALPGEMPVLEDFYKNHQNEGFTVVAIEDGDPPTAVKSFVQKYDLDFSIWLDPTYQATEQAFKNYKPAKFICH